MSVEPVPHTTSEANGPRLQRRNGIKRNVFSSSGPWSVRIQDQIVMSRCIYEPEAEEKCAERRFANLHTSYVAVGV